MHWGLVEIEGLDGKLRKGAAAMDFVLEKIDGSVIVKPFANERFALMLNGVNHVSADDVFRLLSDKLAGKCRSVSVEKVGGPLRSRFVPNVAIPNPVNVIAEYILTLEIGDIDALFDPVAGTPEPWKEKGVQQRLQVLGYLYTPLRHPGNNGPAKHAKACWEYFKRVHKVADDPTAIRKLSEEINANILASGFPGSGEILPKSVLPAPGQFAAIRFPGGYCINKNPLPAVQPGQGDFFFNDNRKSAVDPKYVFDLGVPRDKIEQVVFDENPLMGKLPLIAKVTAKWSDGTLTPVPDVPVLFQLAMPDAVTEASGFRAAELPDKTMNYSVDGSFWPSDAFPHHKVEVAEGLTEAEWKAVHRLTTAAYARDNANAATVAKAWIDNWVAVSIDHTAMTNWWGGDANKPVKLAMSAADLKKKVPSVIYDTPAANPPKLNPPIALSNWNAFLLLARKAKERNPDDPAAAKALAGTWIDTWSQDSPVTWNNIDNWWTAAADQPYPEPLTHAATFKSKLDNALCLPPPADPASVRKTPQGIWDKLVMIANKALEDGAGDVTAARALAETWIQEWEDAAGVGWRNVRDWWGNQADTPYTALDPARTQDAKRVVDFLLDDRTKASPPENTGVGQRKFINDLMTRIIAAAPADDPQKANAPEATYGGKAGAGIKAVFDEPSAAMDGFHVKRPTQTSDYGALRLATLPGDAAKNPHAMECKSNDRGIAGVIFKPSRCGGDTYKLRAYIDPDWLATRSPGAPHRSVVETGTMVVWRNIRLNRYLQFRRHFTSIADISPAMLELFREGGVDPAVGREFGLMHLTSPVTKLLLVPGDDGATAGTNAEGVYPPLSIAYLMREAGGLDSIAFRNQMLKYRPLPVTAVPFQTQFKRAYCEWIADCDGAEAISDSEYAEALNRGKAGFEAYPSRAVNLNWNKLLINDAGSPFFLNMRGKAHYNRLLTPAEKGTALINDEPATGDSFIYGMEYFWSAVAEYFAGGGVLPGLTVIQFGRADTWDGYCLSDGASNSCITSGYATASRAIFLSWTDAKYKTSFIYSATANCLHEIGHTLGIAHQFAGGGNVDESHQDALRTQFTNPTNNECVCVMSYTGCYGDFCGKCILSLRGWRTHV